MGFSVFDIVENKKKQARTKFRVMNFDVAEQKAYEREKQRLFQKEASKTGKQRAKEELFGEEIALKKKKEKRDKLVSTYKKRAGFAGTKTAKVISRVGDIKTPKRSKASLKGLFNRDAFTKQTK